MVIGIWLVYTWGGAGYENNKYIALLFHGGDAVPHRRRTKHLVAGQKVRSSMNNTYIYYSAQKTGSRRLQKKKKKTVRRQLLLLLLQITPEPTDRMQTQTVTVLPTDSPSVVGVPVERRLPEIPKNFQVYNRPKKAYNSNRLLDTSFIYDYIIHSIYNNRKFVHVYIYILYVYKRRPKITIVLTKLHNFRNTAHARYYKNFRFPPPPLSSSPSPQRSTDLYILQQHAFIDQVGTEIQKYTSNIIDYDRDRSPRLILCQKK